MTLSFITPKTPHLESFVLVFSAPLIPWMIFGGMMDIAQVTGFAHYYPAAFLKASDSQAQLKLQQSLFSITVSHSQQAF